MLFISSFCILSWLFSLYRKTAWQERYGSFQNFWHHRLDNNMRNIFLQKSCAKCSGEASPKSFHRKIKLSISTVWNVIKFVFIVCPSQSLLKYVKTKVLTTCFYLKTFYKNKKRSGTSLLISFSALFLKKNVSYVIFY